MRETEKGRTPGEKISGRSGKAVRGGRTSVPNTRIPISGYDTHQTKNDLSRRDTRKQTVSETQNVRREHKGSRGAQPGKPKKRPLQETPEGIERQELQLKKRKKHRGSNILIYMMIFLLILGVGVVLSFTVLFPIQEVKVEGETRYSEDEIRDAAGVLIGENLLSVNTKQASEAVLQQLSYIENANIKREFPNTIVIAVTDAVPAYAYQMEAGGYLLVSSGSKILEKAAKKPEELMLILGVKLSDPTVGAYLSFSKEEQNTLLEKLLAEIEEQEFSEISQIDIADSVNIVMQYDDRIELQFGTSNELSYKIKYAKKVITKELQQDAKGELDLSRLSDVSGDVYFREDKENTQENG